MHQDPSAFSIHIYNIRSKKKLHVAFFFLPCTEENAVENEGKCRKHFHLLLIAQLKNLVENLLNQNQFEAEVNTSEFPILGLLKFRAIEVSSN